MTLHIVGHDGSPRGDDATVLASRLARLYGARLLAVHVVAMPPVRDRFTGPVLDRLEEQSATILAQARHIAPEAETRTVFASSPPAGLQQVCADEGAALVTVGSSHRGRLGRVLAGTTAERLLSGAPCPVALAPRGYPASEDAPRSVVVGYDGGPESVIALDAAVDIARRLGVGVRVVAAAEPPAVVMTPAAVDLMEGLERSSRERAEHLAAEGAERVPDDVVHLAEAVTGEAGAALASVAGAADLLVVGSRRYGPVRSVLVGSVGHHLAHEAVAPVLIVPRGVELDRAGELLGAAHATG
jgi:nucleotide-binding universal stress UspA family protein